MSPRPSSLENPIPPVLNDDQVLTYPQFFKFINVSQRTGRRILAGANPPKATQLSLRRGGVTVRNAREWLQSRERV
jgi:hypothetical protein